MVLRLFCGYIQWLLRCRMQIAMNILLIRHGKTKGNVERRYVGRTDEPILEEERRRLLACAPRMQRPDRIYISPLQRCVQTAQCLYPGRSFTVCPDFRETDFGKFEYKNYEELKEIPEYQSWIDSGGTAAVPAGESGSGFRERCIRGFAKVLEEAAWNHYDFISLVVHGGTIMAILKHYYIEESHYYDWQVKNGEGYLTESDGKQILKAVPFQP